MNITSHSINETRYKITLPCFEAETSAEQRYVRAINDFYRILADKVIAYVSENADSLRLYTVDYTAECDGERLTVTVKLSAKKKSSSGFVTARRSMRNSWAGSQLASTDVVF